MLKLVRGFSSIDISSLIEFTNTNNLLLR